MPDRRRCGLFSRDEAYRQEGTSSLHLLWMWGWLFCGKYLYNRLQRLVPDIAPVVHAGEIDMADCLVRALYGVLHRYAKRRHAEHAPAVGHQMPALVIRGACVKEVHIPKARRLFDSRYRRAGFVGARVSARGKHDTGHIAGAPRQWRYRRQFSARARRERGGEIARKKRQIYLRFRVAEARVELKRFGTVLGRHDARIKKPHKRTLLRRKLPKKRRDDELLNFLNHAFRIRMRERRHGAHTAGHGTLVAFQ